MVLAVGSNVAARGSGGILTPLVPLLGTVIRNNMQDVKALASSFFDPAVNLILL